MQIIDTTELKPPRVLLYGTEGIGKTTFGARSPSPLFILTEDGTAGQQIKHLPLCRSWDALSEAIDFVRYSDMQEYQTLVIDSVSGVEQLIHAQVCRDSSADSIEKAAGGYGKGYTIAATRMLGLADRLDAIRDEQGLAVVMLAHADTEKVDDPETESYTRHSLRCHKKAAGILTAWADVVGFACRKMRLRTDESSGRKIGLTAGEDAKSRVLRLVGGPACVAKNRYGLPEEMPLDAAAFWSAVGG